MEAQSRKRPAPGTSPMPQNRPQEYQQPVLGKYPTVQDPSQLSDDQFLSWGQSTNDAQDFQPQTQNNTQQMNQATGYPDTNQLIRRYQNDQASYQGQQPVQSNQVQRLEAPRNTPPVIEDSDEDDADLDNRAAAAKRDALSRRPPKSIPPFIQKLSSFLDDPKNGDLIRWADDGRSFIVIDEERFANELIPEMFKHNNYASFVRQLNMYGFHKKVGLSDNSMRASEKKAKLPSGYKHKYFRQGRPELLWLIEKPKPGGPAKKGANKKPGGENGDDEGAGGDMDHGGGRFKTHENTDLITLPKAELATVHDLQNEVKSLQRSQQHIYSILGRMRDENNQYIKQASQLVANHERHDQSINAILQFLATFYTQNLQGRGNPNMFSGSVPTQSQHGNVVEEMGDINDSSSDYHSPNINIPPVRRPLALLPAPSLPDEIQSPRQGQKQRQTPPSRLTPLKEEYRPSSAGSSAHSSPQVKKRESPPWQDGTANNQDILNVINRSNAQQNSPAQPRFDFSSALRQYSQDANGKSGPLTPEQRETMLSIMANHSGANTPSITSGNVKSGNSNGNPNNVMDPSPYLDYFNNHQEQLDMLQRLQEEQDSRVQDLAGRLQPLSPSGSIPGLETVYNNSSQQGNDGKVYPGSYNANSDGFDFDNYLNDDFLDNPNGNTDLNADDYDLDWAGLDGTPNDNLFGDEAVPGGQGEGNSGATGGHDDFGGEGGRVVGSVTNSESSQTPRGASVEDTGDNEDGAQHSSKRRKL